MAILFGDDSDNTIAGTSEADEIYALGRRDSVSGRGGDDFIDGGADNDTLSGGAGADTLLGGDGHDHLIGDRGGDSIDAGAGRDYITITVTVFNGMPQVQGGTGWDRLRLEGTFVASHFMLTRAESIEALEVSGNLRGTPGDDVFDLSAVTSLYTHNPIALGNGADIYTGGSGENCVDGGGGNDTLTGGRANDWLDGGAGIDRLVGGSGKDTYVLSVPYDVVIEGANGGRDMLQAPFSLTLGANFEELTLLGTANVDGTGNGHDNLMNGNAGGNRLVGFSGDDTLFGGDGDDYLDGGVGRDILHGGSGNDTLLVFGDGAPMPMGVSGGDGQDILVIDGVVAVSQLRLAQSGNGIEGLDIRGELTGTAGNDSFAFYGLTEYGELKMIMLHAGRDSFYGSALGDIVDGGDGDDVLAGFGGDDTLFGGVGNDTYAVDAAGDLAIEDRDGGHDSVQTSVNLTLGANLEDLLLLDGARNGFGNDLNNVITGNDARNLLRGGGGNDTLTVGLGADTLTGGNGADWFVYEDSQDINFRPTNPGVITDFVSGTDKIDLRQIANFRFIRDAEFGRAGDLRFSEGVLQGDIDGDGSADFMLNLPGVARLTGLDFL